MKRVLVTGANRGIGLELCRQLLTSGAEVIAVCRRSSEALESIGAEIRSGIDVGSDSDVEALAESLSGTTLDLLINCAGVMIRSTLSDLDIPSMRRQFEINSLGPLRMTVALLPCLREGSKVAIVTSRMGSVADNSSGGSYGYRMSKCAVNMAGASLAIDLAPQKIAVALLHPGYVRTDMTGGNGLIDVDESASGMLARIEELTLESSGGFWHTKGEALPW